MTEQTVDVGSDEVRRRVSAEELADILADHVKWQESTRREGARADLSGTVISDIRLPQPLPNFPNFNRKVRLNEANFTGANISRCVFDNVDFSGADLGGTEISEMDLSGRTFSKTNFSGTTFAGVRLRGAHFHNADLTETNLREADLRGATFHDATLAATDLTGADLSGAILAGAPDLQEKAATVPGAKFADCNLRDADLSDVRELHADQLGGADVTGAKLPPAIAEFKALEHVEELSRNARKIFLAMLLVCLYGWLTIATADDLALVMGGTTTPLPIVQSPMETAHFLVAVPLGLLCLFIYFHLYMQRLWESLAKLPAVFPDGVPLDRKAYPWLLLGMVRVHMRRLRPDGGVNPANEEDGFRVGGRGRGREVAFARTQHWIAGFLAWGAVPFTMLGFWERYLTRQEPWGTVFLVLVFAGGAFVARAFYQNARSTLRRESLGSWRRPTAASLLLGISIVSLGYMSFGVLQAEPGQRPFDPRTVAPVVFHVLPFLDPFADLSGRDISTRPKDILMLREIASLSDSISKAGARPTDADVSVPSLASNSSRYIIGAKLPGTSLRYANAAGAFLAKADLHDAKLQKIDLKEANLEEANLEKAKLSGANLAKADLVKANLGGEADLRNAMLVGADLRGAYLQWAHLEGAHLQGANLRGGHVLKAHLQGADLRGADLRAANLWDADLKGAVLVKADFRGGKLRGSDLRDADLRGADFRRLHLPGGDLPGADLYDAALTCAQLKSAVIDETTTVPVSLEACREEILRAQ